MTEGSRPYSDEQIAQHLANVQDEAVEGKALIGPSEDLEALKAEYDQGCSVYQRKITALKEQYPRFRRSRGDGNCFFRAFGFAWFEALLTSKDEQLLPRTIKHLEGTKQLLEAAGFEMVALEEFYDLTLDLLRALPTHTRPSLLSNFNDPETSNAIVCYLRFLTAAHVRTHPDDFAPFIEEANGDVARYCERTIEAFGQESEGIAVIALVRALHVPIQVVYLDGRGNDPSSDEANIHTFNPDEEKRDATMIHPSISLLYRPGHYDLLYSRDSMPSEPVNDTE
ncbi:otubain-like cysteine protease [Piptocephalis cylindrospora]|uniref:ubiquitinyl hydrolase 1 n=1 Tax=Piptocephalis cylindrospora TaxID=1907219 RepID=A0A4P9Y7V8_9FUNG|nr:otubain-like cysteine protease [Piptocephalis cylindrospora]|eukprot:RKP14371.1 otubain-like cysteine protease [Piptocephalis cylindrospora]